MAKVTVTTIDATRCASKVKAGKACTMAELRATVMLLQEGLKSSRSAGRIARNQLAEKSQMVRDLLGRVMR